jgi:hypothetical protein
MTRGLVLAAALTFAVSSPARAELVRLTNGRVMSVDSCRFDGDTVVISFRNGGEVRTPKEWVAEILPDEVPHARAFALEALAISPSAAAPVLSATAIRAMVDRIATQVGVDLRLAHAVVQVESNYDPKAISSKGAMGLMQIMPVIVQQYAVDDPFDPEKNLQAGMKYLRSMLDRFGRDTTRALAAYNAGEGAVSRYGGVPPYRETQDYVRQVLAILRQH